MSRASGRLFLVVVAACTLASAALAESLPRTPLRNVQRASPRRGPSEVGQGVANVRNFGAVGSGSVDDTDAIQSAIDSLNNTGGIVYFPAGTYLVNGQLALPNDEAAENTKQPAYVFSGVGAFFNPRGGIAFGGTILDMRYSDGPKLVTYGLGLLEISGITFASFGGDSQAFIYTTNTTLHIHDSGFYGNKPNHTADNDAIILGGTSAEGTGGPAPNAPFQGYGTVIRDNFFARTRRVVYGRVFANAVVVTGNTVWKNCGSNLPDGAAIELDGDPDDATPQVNGGWYVAGNLIEMQHYPYGIKARESQRSAFIANNFYDPSFITLAYYRFEPSGQLNYVLAGFHSDGYPFVEELATGTGRNTVINFHQAQESRYPQRARFYNDVITEPTSSSEAPHGPRVVNSGGTELTYQLIDDRGMLLTYTPFGGGPVDLWEVHDLGNGNIVQELKGADPEIRSANGSLKIRTRPGSALELGDTDGNGVKIEDGKLSFKGRTTARLL